MNLKRMTEEQLWQEYGRCSGLSVLLKAEIERRIRFGGRKNKMKKSKINKY